MAIDRVILLDENTANRIAAGEVVERPASAVKELVENALDADATQILVELEEGGKRSIRVTDNGHGMTRTDAILALQRHATSKIRTADDLFAIRTLGFRGEALPSIASVSRFTLTSRPHDLESGIRILAVGGDIQAVEETAAREGTRVEVEDLFFNTPARLKFLKSTPTEIGRAIDVVGNLAVAYPGVAFRLRHGSQEIFVTPGNGDPLGALAAVWGRDVARRLVPARHESPGLTVHGYIATPDATRPGRTHQLFFVNLRPIKNRVLTHALEEAFRSLTPESRHPIATLFVEMNPELVDVNVHPTKTEVKFTRDGEIHHAAGQAVKSALLQYGIVPTVRSTPGTAAVAPPPPAGPVPTGLTGNLRFAQTYAGSQEGLTGDPTHSSPTPRADVSGLFAGSIAGGLLDGPPEEPDALPLVQRPRPKPFAEQLREFQILGQARNMYIVALTPDGIAVIDQHVAHERVLYERLTVKRFSQGIPVQRLAVPLTLQMSRREALLLAEHCGHFAPAGWEIEPFGGESFVIRAIPAILANKPYAQVLRDMIDELVNQTVSRRLLVQQDHVTITNACKMAVKAGDPLNREEMQSLIEQLAETENPYLCPHGRPIVVTVPFHELDRQFKRA